MNEENKLDQVKEKTLELNMRIANYLNTGEQADKDKAINIIGYLLYELMDEKKAFEINKIIKGVK